MSEAEPEGTWPAAWGKSVIGLCALSAIKREQPVHGYAVMAAIREALRTDTTGGVVYPLLKAFEAEGLLGSTWEAGVGGPGRKVYTMTSRGDKTLAALELGWSEFSGAVTGMLRPVLEEGRKQ
jgi:PadR family transcriptional regulator PadR